ncbi:xanthine dehydrogenase family protein molybdopterin-binding subunit [Candidatus Poriferisocius sp.]|uniref:xanthine dehydrogenase family protein molybdopterin-binding subunit n=1 Tax=Candidatus Poriferisocius sp. TaxID=3101276 RepID=UPI003B017348
MSTTETTQTSGLGFVGQSVTRVEDDRLLRGNGQYVADVDPPGVLHAAFLRSTFPHARITRLDVSAARAANGVVAVFTGEDMEEKTHPFPPFFMLPNLYTPLYCALSSEKVRHVGDPIALVVAESRYLAEDALELIEVDYEPLDAVANISQAFETDREQLWDKADGNVLYDGTRTYGDVDAVFAGADRIVTEQFSCQRQSNQPMETRGIVIEVGDGGSLTVHSATQVSHVLRWILAALTEKEPLLDSVKAVFAQKNRRSAFAAAAKEFREKNKETLDKQDNTGAKHQIKRDRSLISVMPRIGLGLLGKERYPTVVAKDIGGGFGAKGAVTREDVAVAVAAIDLGRSVKWIEDRVENLTDGGQAREEDITVSVALDNDGTFRGLKVDLVVDQGAYPAFPVGAALFTQIIRVMVPGAYRWDAFEQRSRVVATNKGRYVAYRGPWANETWVRERIIDVAARALGLSPTELRLKNMIGEDDMPTEMLTGPTIDETMSTRKTFVKAIELMGLDEVERQRAAAAAEGRALGIGFACYHEAAPGPPNYNEFINPGTSALLGETARTVVEADGSIKVFTPQMPHGQSHETTYAQVAATELGVSIEDVEVVYGNTSKTPFGVGTGGSRGGPIGGGAVRGSSREVRQQVVDKAARMLEAAVDDIEIVDGNIHVSGVSARGLSYADVARAAAGDAAAADAEAFQARCEYEGKGDGGWSCATHACIVEVDLQTGLVDIPRYIVVEDCGPVINPAIVDGQVRGGVAQGIGAVLYEYSAYDDHANLQATTYMDYLIPTTMEIPHIEVHHIETLSPGGENDFRGVGEGGMIGTPAALTNAIEDALASRCARVIDQYLPPTKILELAGVIDPD